MDSLLFQNTSILWVGSWIPSLLISFCIVGVAFVWYVLIKKYHNRPRKKIPSIYTWIHSDDMQHHAKTLQNLKLYLLDRYIPHHVTAHTAEEIKKYVQPNELGDILIELESALYSGKPWTPEDAERINTALKKYIHE